MTPTGLGAAPSTRNVCMLCGRLRRTSCSCSHRAWFALSEPIPTGITRLATSPPPRRPPWASTAYAQGQASAHRSRPPTPTASKSRIALPVRETPHPRLERAPGGMGLPCLCFLRGLRMGNRCFLFLLRLTADGLLRDMPLLGQRLLRGPKPVLALPPTAHCEQRSVGQVLRMSRTTHMFDKPGVAEFVPSSALRQRMRGACEKAPDSEHGEIAQNSNLAVQPPSATEAANAYKSTVGMAPSDQTEAAA